MAETLKENEDLKKAADKHDDELAGEQEKIVSCPFFGCE